MNQKVKLIFFYLKKKVPINKVLCNSVQNQSNAPMIIRSAARAVLPPSDAQNLGLLNFASSPNTTGKTRLSI